MKNQINSHRKYAIAFIETHGTFAVDEMYLHEFYQADPESGEDDESLCEYKYAIQDNIDEILDLKVGERLAMKFIRDNSDSDGFIRRIQ